MNHDCRIGYLETSEDDEGYFYIEWKRAFGTNTGKFKVEYCPVCGMKARKSSIEDLNLFDIEDVDPLKHMHDIIVDLFFKSCDIIIKEDLDDLSFQMCEDTIRNTLQYVKGKRKEKNVRTKM